MTKGKVFVCIPLLLLIACVPLIASCGRSPKPPATNAATIPRSIGNPMRSWNDDEGSETSFLARGRHFEHDGATVGIYFVACWPVAAGRDSYMLSTYTEDYLQYDLEAWTCTTMDGLTIALPPRDDHCHALGPDMVFHDTEYLVSEVFSLRNVEGEGTSRGQASPEAAIDQNARRPFNRVLQDYANVPSETYVRNWTPPDPKMLRPVAPSPVENAIRNETASDGAAKPDEKPEEGGDTE